MAIFLNSTNQLIEILLTKTLMCYINVYLLPLVIGIFIYLLLEKYFNFGKEEENAWLRFHFRMIQLFGGGEKE